MTDTDSVRVRPERLETFVASVLRAAGVARPHREVVAAALVRADLRGVDSHGVARLEPYVEHFEAGGFNPDPDVEITERGAGVIVVDGDDGPGQSVGKRTMERLVGLSRSAGVAVGVVRNSNHFGTAAYYTEMAADDGCIGMAATNVPEVVIPFGGTEPVLGTNPISVSFPTPREYPITLDMATSVVALGKIEQVAAEKDETIPEEWAVDEHGEPTTDPHAVSALRPFGGPKGYGLGVVVDLLAGILSGAGSSLTAGSLYENFDEPMGLGQWFLAIDVATVRDMDAYETDVAAFVEGIKAVEPEDGVDEVMLPGEIEAKTMARNRERGVPVSRPVFEKLESIADAYDVELPPTIE